MSDKYKSRARRQRIVMIRLKTALLRHARRSGYLGAIKREIVCLAEGAHP